MSMIKNNDYFKQGILFDNLLHGKRHPTDIDAMVELNDKAYYFVELKRKGSYLRDGQKILFERLCNALYKTGKSAYAILAHHTEHTQDKNGDIYLRHCFVDEIYYPYLRTWKEPEHQITVGDFDDWFYEKFDRR